MRSSARLMIAFAGVCICSLVICRVEQTNRQFRWGIRAWAASAAALLKSHLIARGVAPTVQQGGLPNRNVSAADKFSNPSKQNSAIAVQEREKRSLINVGSSGSVKESSRENGRNNGNATSGGETGTGNSPSQGLTQNYYAFFQANGIEPSDQQRILGIVERHSTQATNSLLANAAAVSGGTMSADWVASRQPLKDEAEEITSLYGKEIGQAFLDYTHSLPYRQLANQVATSSAASGSDMTPEAINELTDLLQVTNVTPRLTGPFDEKTYALLTANDSTALSAASDILNSAQIAALRLVLVKRFSARNQ